MLFTPIGDFGQRATAPPGPDPKSNRLLQLPGNQTCSEEDVPTTLMTRVALIVQVGVILALCGTRPGLIGAYFCAAN